MKTSNLAEIVQRIPLCGCGDPDVPLAILRDVLEHMPLYEERNWAYVNDDPWKVFALQAIDSWGLIEHGGTILGSWATVDGNLLLEFLQLIDSQYRYWQTLTTAILNEPIPDEIDLPWLEETEGHYWLREGETYTPGGPLFDANH